MGFASAEQFESFVTGLSKYQRRCLLTGCDTTTRSYLNEAVLFIMKVLEGIFVPSVFQYLKQNYLSIFF
jgi:hypothetical protein